MTIKRVWVKDEKVVAIEPREKYKPLFSVRKKEAGGQAPLGTHLFRLNTLFHENQGSSRRRSASSVRLTTQNQPYIDFLEKLVYL